MKHYPQVNHALGRWHVAAQPRRRSIPFDEWQAMMRATVVPQEAK